MATEVMERFLDQHPEAEGNTMTPEACKRRVNEMAYAHNQRVRADATAQNSLIPRCWQTMGSDNWLYEEVHILFSLLCENRSDYR